MKNYRINNLDTPITILIERIKDMTLSVRESIASNPKTPPKVLKLLAKDKIHTVRCKVASNPNTPREVKRICRRWGQSAEKSYTEFKSCRIPWSL
jgi:hypothetical protein